MSLPDKMKAESIVQCLLDSEDMLNHLGQIAVDPLYQFKEAAEAGKSFELNKSHEDQHGVKHEFRIRLSAGSEIVPQSGIRSLDVHLDTTGSLTQTRHGGWIIINIKKDPNALPGIVQLLRKMFDTWRKFGYWQYGELCNSFFAFNTSKRSRRRKRRTLGVRRYD